jgi:hypothetical protein
MAVYTLPDMSYNYGALEPDVIDRGRRPIPLAVDDRLILT